MIDVKIKLLDGGIMPTKAHKDDAAWDCYAGEDVTIPNSVARDSAETQAKLIGLGFCMELPKGYHAEIVPRSSIGLKTTLRQPNSVGIIDSGYRGEVKVMYELNDFSKIALTTDSCRYTVRKGERICQMLIVKDPEVKLVQVDELSDSTRGTGGFGSTGTK